MTAAGLLSLDELAEQAEQAELAPDAVRRYAEVGLLAPALRVGDRYGYLAREVDVLRLVRSAEQLGIVGGRLIDLAVSWRGSDCGVARAHLTGAVATRLDVVQSDLAQYGARAAQSGPGSEEWAASTRRAVELTEQAAKLQAVATGPTAGHADGQCGSDCTCGRALAARGDRFQFPVAEGDQSGSAGLACDLVAAEYRCCAFGSYAIAVDESGLTLEVRMPAQAAGQLAAVFGSPDSPAEAEGLADATHTMAASLTGPPAISRSTEPAPPREAA